MLEKILDAYPDDEFLRADGLDDAIIGVHEPDMRLIYSVSKCIEVLMHDNPDWDYMTAAEYFSFNVERAYVGEQTPIWCQDDFL